MTNSCIFILDFCDFILNKNNTLFFFFCTTLVYFLVSNQWIYDVNFPRGGKKYLVKSHPIAYIGISAAIVQEIIHFIDLSEK